MRCVFYVENNFLYTYDAKLFTERFIWVQIFKVRIINLSLSFHKIT
jgi:hypothetical protein